MKLRREIGDQRGLVWSLSSIATIAMGDGDVTLAHSYYLEALGIAQRFGSATEPAEVLEDLASCLVAIERPQLAARVLSSASAFRSNLGVPFKPWRGRQAGYDRTIAKLRDALGAQTYAEVWAEGAKLPLDQVIAEVLAT